MKVNKQSDKYFTFTKGSWFRNDAGIRAPGTRTQRVDYTLTTSTYACNEFGAAKGVPDEIVANADNPLAPMREATEFVTDKLLMKVEIDVAAVVFGSSVWSSSANASIKWDDDTSDPIKEVLGSSTAIKEVLRQYIGRYPNVCIIGATVYAALQRHSDLLDRVKYTNTMYGINTQMLAQFFQIDKVLVGTAIYESAQEGATSSVADIWGKFAWFGYVPPSPGLMVPAAGYILSWKDRQVNQYREDQEHQNVVEALMNYDVVTTSADSGYLLKAVVD